jgi:transposase
LTTKIHAVCDASGKPTALMLTPGQTSDLHGFDELAATIKSPVVIGDKGYDADKRVRDVLADAGKTAVIPPRRNRTNPASYDKELYKKRHKIENFFSRLKDFRSIATRYEKTARNFLAGVHLAAAIIWLD